MNALLDRLFTFVRTHACILCIGMGMGIYRCAHEWPVWFGETYLSTQETLPFGLDAFLIVDIGKVVGVVVYAITCYRFDKTGKSGFLLALPSAVLLVGYTLPLSLLSDGPIAGRLAHFCMIVCGTGAGMLFAQWIEVCGRLSPLSVIETLAVSYLVRFVLLPIVTGLTLHLSALMIIVLAGSSFIQIALCQRLLPSPLGGEKACTRTLPRRNAGTGYGILFAWACIYAFTFGLGEASTQLAHHVTVSGMGYVVPSLLVVVLSVTLGDRFDRNFLYAISIPLMAAGLMGLEFFGVNAALAQTLVSAGMCAFELLVYTTACIYAYRSRTSAMFAASCVRVIALVAADVAVMLVRCIPELNVALLIVAAMVATVAMGFVMFLPQVAERLEQRQISAPHPGDSHVETLRQAASKVGLSPRETTVFLLLADNKSANQISSELFISNGAVRSHCSRIYDKFGVHSRKELDALLEKSGRR